MDEQEVLDQQRELHERQQTGLGSTDTPKILGISKYGTPLTVWESKQGSQERSASSLPAWLGQQLQSTVAELYRVATGHRVRAANKQYRHKQDPWLVCHLDYRIHGSTGTIVECKTRAYLKGWGEDGSSNIPADVWAQVQHQMMVTAAQQTHVAVLFGHHTFRVYVIPRDEQFIAALRDRLRQFWHDHVLTGVPPEPTGHPFDARYLSKTHPQDSGDVLTASAQQATLVQELAQRMVVLKSAQALVDEAENKIKAALGDATGFYSPYGTVLWKTTAPRKYVNYEQVAYEVIGMLPPDIDPQAVTGVWDAHTQVKPGVRRFTYTPPEEP